jgi:hypothetical protein
MEGIHVILLETGNGSFCSSIRSKPEKHNVAMVLAGKTLYAAAFMAFLKGIILSV